MTVIGAHHDVIITSLAPPAPLKEKDSGESLYIKFASRNAIMWRKWLM